MTDPDDQNRAADPTPPVPYSPPPFAPPVPSAPPTVPYPAVDYPPVSGTPQTQLPVPYPPPAAGYGQPGYGQTPYGQAGYPGGGGAFDPFTGQPLSDKSKITAGLLQLVLGFLFTLGGVGRLYAGNTALGAIQIVASVVAWASFWCGWAIAFLSWPLWIGIWLWFVIDGVVILAGRPVDGQGRLLRN